MGKSLWTSKKVEGPRRAVRGEGLAAWWRSRERHHGVEQIADPLAGGGAGGLDDEGFVLPVFVQVGDQGEGRRGLGGAVDCEGDRHWGRVWSARDADQARAARHGALRFRGGFLVATVRSAKQCRLPEKLKYCKEDWFARG